MDYNLLWYLSFYGGIAGIFGTLPWRRQWGFAPSFPSSFC